MFVRNIMIEDLTTVSPDDTLQTAYDLIQSKRYDCLPVMSEPHILAGIIQVTDIYEACMKDGRQVVLPQPVRVFMTDHTVTVTPETLVEVAAKIMFQRDIPMVPVVEDGRLVGVVTESDIFRCFADMLGVDSGTTRLTLVVPERRGQLARVAEIIRDAGISITHLSTFQSKVLNQYSLVVRVETHATKPLVELLEQHGYKVNHVDVD